MFGKTAFRFGWGCIRLKISQPFSFSALNFCSLSISKFESVFNVQYVAPGHSSGHLMRPDETEELPEYVPWTTGDDGERWEGVTQRRRQVAWVSLCVFVKYSLKNTWVMLGRGILIPEYWMNINFIGLSKCVCVCVCVWLCSQSDSGVIFGYYHRKWDYFLNWTVVCSPWGEERLFSVASRFPLSSYHLPSRPCRVRLRKPQPRPGLDHFDTAFA